MSLPQALRNWVSCPYCNECQDIKRIGLIGIRGVPDSKRFECGFCGKTFSAEGGTMLENMGRDSEGNYPFRDV
jgi:transposase-like protein